MFHLSYIRLAHDPIPGGSFPLPLCRERTCSLSPERAIENLSVGWKEKKAMVKIFNFVNWLLLPEGSLSVVLTDDEKSAAFLLTSARLWCPGLSLRALQNPLFLCMPIMYWFY
jgi:hypothetical protein